MKSLFNTLHFIFHHPLTRNHPVRALRRYLGWQVVSRMHGQPMLYPFVEQSCLIVQRGMTGATGNIYTGLHEFADMGFLLHLLRPGDLFGDIGANIGSYTILASAVTKADSISIEPVARTFLHLKHNVAINDLETRVILHQCGIGAEPGRLLFTNTQDTVNHVVATGESAATEQVEVRTLDDIFMDRVPVLIKIDVEGFEMAVLKGAGHLLAQDGLKAIIIELNGLCHRYGIREEDIHGLLYTRGFEAVCYDPLTRKLTPLSSFNKEGNTIYARDPDWIRSRTLQARKIKILGQEL